MTDDEKRIFWEQTVQAAKNWDPRFLKAIAAVLVLRHGELQTCEQGCHTFPMERLTLEEFHHIIENYSLGIRSPETGVIEVSVIAKEYLANDGHLPGGLNG